MTIRRIPALIFGMALAWACARQDHSQAVRPAQTEADSVPTIMTLVRADTYEVRAEASNLPSDVRAAIARDFGESQFRMASADEPYSSGCVYEPSLPRQRLLLAAISPRFAVVHFETGGYAIAQHVTVFSRSAKNNEAEKIYSNFAGSAWEEPQSFLSAIHSGDLFVDRSKARAIGIGT